MSSLILYDDYNNLFHCNYVNHDNLDKLPLCILEYVQPNGQNLPTLGTVLHYFDNINRIVHDYIIYQIIYENDCSLICKINIPIYENRSPILYFAYMHPMSKRTLLWELMLQNFLQQWPDYLICKLINYQGQSLMVVCEKSKKINNAYLIRPLEKNEQYMIKNNAIINHVFLIESQLSLSYQDQPIFHDWIAKFKAPHFQFMFNKLMYVNTQPQMNISENQVLKQNEDKNVNMKDSTSSQEELNKDHEKQEDETTSESISDNSSCNSSEMNSESKLHDSLSESSENSHLEDHELVCMTSEDTNRIVPSTSSSMEQEEVVEIITEKPNETSKIISEEITTEKHEEIISEERDTFYDGCVMSPIYDSEYVINKQLISFKEDDIVDDEVESIATSSNESISSAQKNKKKRLKKKQKKLAQIKIENQDDIIDLVYLFDSFYESYIIQNVIPKNIIYDKFLELITLYEKELQEKDTQSIFEFIFEKFKTNFPSIMNDPSYIKSNFLEEKSPIDDMDLEQSEQKDDKLIVDIVNKELENIVSTKEDGVILIPYIKKFQDIFGDVFKNIDPDKKKVLLLYLSFSVNSGYNNLNEYFKVVPSILFRTKVGIASNGYLEEEKVTIFHMTWLLNVFDKYIIEKLYKNSKEKNTPELLIFLNKLLFQYFATYIVHNEINAILVVPKNIYNHYLRVIGFHLKYLFPHFHYKSALNLQKINLIETEKPFVDKFILKSRLMVSKLLETLPDDKYYVATGYMSKFLNTYFYDKNKDMLNSFMLHENPNRDTYFENQISIQFHKVVNMLDNK